MQIYIANKLAALKQGTSFEYVSENRLFSGSDGYTLTITFPLKDCPRNQAIFGHINRADVSAGKVVFDCEIRDKGFYKFGCITVTEINEAEVKTQFLDGRSEQNFDKTFDKVYINELDLGKPSVTSKSSITPERAWYPGYSNYEAVALPWVNDASGNIQNKAECVVDNEAQGRYHYEWSADTSGLSWQPYLLFITKKICQATGYSFDFSKWEEMEEYKYLLICNCLPFSWYTPEYARALPHWTVEEYFEKLELFLQGEFTIDHRAKHISFAFSKAVLENTRSVRLDDVVEEHSTEIKVEESQCEYSVMKNRVYKECDHEMWRYYDCDWYIKGNQWNIERYNTMSELLAANRGYANWDGQHHRNNRIDKILYAADCDSYFIIRSLSRTGWVEWRGSRAYLRFNYKCRLQPINQFGGHIVNDAEDADEEEIEFVPAWIDDTEDKYGRCLFLSFSGYDEDNGSIEGEDESKYPFATTRTDNALKAGERDKKAEYYDRIYIGFWDGAQNTRRKLPHPDVEDIYIAEDWSNFNFLHFSLRINNGMLNRRIAPEIEPTMKTTFKFIADKLPDVRALFFIRGKRYICEKLTATFTEHGMSQLIKGVFYPVKD